MSIERFGHFAYVVEAVEKMAPGHDMEFAREVLMFPTPPPFNAADWVLEQIMGASYEFSYYRKPETGNIVFRRRLKPCDSAYRTYVSPDRLHLVTKLGDGWYECGAEKPNETSLTNHH